MFPFFGLFVVGVLSLSFLFSLSLSFCVVFVLFCF